jgi:hypothetical protein
VRSLGPAFTSSCYPGGCGEVLAETDMLSPQAYEQIMGRLLNWRAGPDSDQSDLWDCTMSVSRQGQPLRVAASRPKALAMVLRT